MCCLALAQDTQAEAQPVLRGRPIRRVFGARDKLQRLFVEVDRIGEGQVVAEFLSL